VTPMGKRLLRAWMLRPSIEVAEINARLESVEALVKDIVRREELRRTLDGILDLERLLSRVTLETANPRDVLALAASLARIPKVRTALAGLPAARITALHKLLDELVDLREKIDSTLVSEPPLTLSDGGVIASGIDKDLDELRDLSRNSKQYLTQVEQRERDASDAQLLIDKARLALAVIIFPDFRQDFTVVDDLDQINPLASFSEVQDLALAKSPELRAAQANLQQGQAEISVARTGYLPALSLDYFYGIDANQVAIYNRDHEKNLGSVAQATLTIPVWTWGATQSKVRQAELKQKQAQIELTFAQRQLMANLNSFYREAQLAQTQLDSLRKSMDLSQESLRLTLLRYEAGEATALEVVDAQTTLAQARNAYDDGLSRYRIALAAIQTLTGNL